VANNSICDCGSQGGLSEVCIIVGATTTRFDFVAENLALKSVQGDGEPIVGNQGITGSLDLFADHIRKGPAWVEGSLVMSMSAKELDVWLPLILRGTEVSDTHFPGLLSPSFDILVKRDQGTFRYNGCQVDKFLITAEAMSEEPSLVTAVISVIGKDEVQGTWPNPAPARLATNNLYWLMADSTLTLNNNEYSFERFSLMYDNMLTPLIRNSLRPLCIRSEGRRTMLQAQLPMCSNTLDNLYWTPLDGAGSLNFESSKNLGVSTSQTNFQFARLYGPKVSPGTRGKSETFLQVNLQSYPGANPTTDPSLKVYNKFPA
jgi:hypothetical protein